MKKTILLLLAAVFFAGCTGTDKEPQHNIAGTWETHVYQGKPNDVVAHFKADSTFEGIINGKLFVSGKYKTSGDTVILNDPGCEGYDGYYQLSYFKDSLGFSLIKDSCEGRKRGLDGIALKKVK